MYIALILQFTFAQAGVRTNRRGKLQTILCISVRSIDTPGCAATSDKSRSDLTKELSKRSGTGKVHPRPIQLVCLSIAHLHRQFAFLLTQSHYHSDENVSHRACTHTHSCVRNNFFFSPRKPMHTLFSFRSVPPLRGPLRIRTRVAIDGFDNTRTEFACARLIINRREERRWQHGGRCFVIAMRNDYRRRATKIAYPERVRSLVVAVNGAEIQVAARMCIDLKPGVNADRDLPSSSLTRSSDDLGR